jgi:hypothetical protein
MLSYPFLDNYAECYHAEYHYAKRHYGKWHYVFRKIVNEPKWNATLQWQDVPKYFGKTYFDWFYVENKF